MKKFIEKLQFITHDLNHLSHVEQAGIVCQAGGKWIQYRCLTKNDEELLEDINQIAEICDDWGATLIVTDHIHLNGKADIQGFHIEDMNANFLSIRASLGEAVTIGGSSNTLEGLLRLAKEGVDYAGLGPFAHTDTKPNDFPLLGVAGYEKAMLKLKESEIELPIIAVGGVGVNDVEALMQTGIFGVAVSAAINRAADVEAAYLDFYQQLR
jgi:thiamine-phosphate pyrophosphorylase